MHCHAFMEGLTLQDVHGQFYDLLNIFELNGLPSEENPYLFNGVQTQAPTHNLACCLKGALRQGNLRLPLLRIQRSARVCR